MAGRDADRRPHAYNHGDERRPRVAPDRQEEGDQRRQGDRGAAGEDLGGEPLGPLPEVVDGVEHVRGDERPAGPDQDALPCHSAFPDTNLVIVR
jgi:hypothetical protein